MLAQGHKIIEHHMVSYEWCMIWSIIGLRDNEHRDIEHLDIEHLDIEHCGH